MTQPARDINLLVSADELSVITLIRQGGVDADYEVVVRDGRVMNVKESKIHRKQFVPQQERPLREQCQG